MWTLHPGESAVVISDAHDVALQDHVGDVILIQEQVRVDATYGEEYEVTASWFMGGEKPFLVWGRNLEPYSENECADAIEFL